MLKSERINIIEVIESKRLDAETFVSNNAQKVRQINQFDSNTIKELAFIHKVRNRDSRIYVKDKCRGLMYLSNTDMQKTSYDSTPYMSKKFLSNIEKQKLKVGDIIISAVGTIGQVAYVNKTLENAVISGNILRITPKNMNGFIYAYFASSYGQANLINMASGSVQDFITPPKLSDYKIPIFPKEKQEEIHQLIVDSANLRMDAYKLLNEAIGYFENELGKTKVELGFQIGTINSNSINVFHKRLDSQYQLLWNGLKKEQVKDLKYIKVDSIAKKIFVGNRGKRMYVKDGIPFLSSSEMMLFNPKSKCKKINKNTPLLSTLLVEKNNILISRSGTVGNTVIVSEDLNNIAISEHALRLVVDTKKILPEYVFCFLKTKYGMRSMEASSFGSVIITLNEELIGNIELPILGKEIASKIASSIQQYQKKLDAAISNENQAISLIEKEIDSWQN